METLPGCGLSFAAPAGEEDRHEDHVEERRGQEAAQNHDPHGTLDLIVRLVAGENERDQREAGGERRHEDRRESLVGPSADRLGEREPLLAHQVLVVGDQQHAIASGDSEKRDEAHECRHAQRFLAHHHGEDTADQRHGEVHGHRPLARQGLFGMAAPKTRDS